MRLLPLTGFLFIVASGCMLILGEDATLVPVRKKALILGTSGQDGYYMTDFLLSKGYEVHGSLRSTSNKQSIDALYKSNPLAMRNLFLHYGNITDQAYITNLFSAIKPDELYNLAAQSDIASSFKDPINTSRVNGLSVLMILEALRNSKCTSTRFCQASSAEIFGRPLKVAHNEQSQCNPVTPYGIAKLFAHNMTKLYRENFGIFACNGILFNHESPKRSLHFVTRKTSDAVAQRASGKKNILVLGDLNATRDWGYAGDYIQALWLMLQQQKADDYVIATGKTYTVRDFVEHAYREIGITIQWQGKGIHERGIDSKTKEVLVQIDPNLFRPEGSDSGNKAAAKNEILRGDASKARKVLKWKPSLDFRAIVKLMVSSDIQLQTSKRTR